MNDGDKALLQEWKHRLVLGFHFWRQTPLLGITYDNDKHQDGVGSQLHRIYAIYALTRLLKLRYVHSPLKKIPYQGLAALENKTEDPTLVDRCNQLFTIPSDVEPPAETLVHEINNLDLDTLLNLKKQAQRENRFILVRCVFPFLIQERVPESCGYITKISPFQAGREAGNPVRIALHVRRGELALVAPERILPNSYYIHAAKKIIAILEAMRLDYVVELHTELPSSPFQITTKSPGLQWSKAESIMLNPETHKLEEFECLPHLKRFINLDALEALKGLATADILVMSRSSFSLLAALLSPHAVILYSPFWHAGPRSWIRTAANGDFPDDLFLRQWEANLR